MPQKKNRVTQQTLKRRRMIALAVIILLVIIIIYAICSACSGGNNDVNGNSDGIRTSTVTTTSSDSQNPITQTTPVQTGSIMESVTVSQTSSATSPSSYVISLVVLAFTSKKSRAPKAEGIPYDKGTR